MSRARSRALRESGRADRGRRLRDGLEPAGAGGGRRTRWPRRPDRTRLRRPAVSGARLGGRAGVRDRPGAGWRRRHARGDADRGRGRDRRPGGLHARRRAAGAGGVRRADPQRPPVAPAGLPGRPCGGRRAGPRRDGDRVHGPSRRPDARRRADPRPGGGPGRSRRRRGQPRHADPRGRAPAPAVGGRAPRLGRGGDRRAAGPGRRPIGPSGTSRSRDGRCCPSRTRPGWSSSGGVSSATASSSCRPAGRPVRCATPVCRSPMWRP